MLLIVSRGIMELHRGTISVFSEGEGYGSTFSLGIPAYVLPVSPEAASEQPSSSRQTPSRLTASSRFEGEVAGGRGADFLMEPVCNSSGNSASSSSQSGARRVVDSPANANAGETLMRAYDSPEVPPRRHLASISQPFLSISNIRTSFVTSAASNPVSVTVNDNRPKERDKSAQISTIELEDSFSGFNLTLFMVDDSRMNRKLYLHVLRSHVKSYAEAVDGLAAVSQLRSRLESGEPAFDVILMDNMMPNMDGPTATRAMRDMGYEGLIIGMMSCDTYDQYSEAFLDHGADRVLLKPFRLASFLQIINGEILKFLLFNYRSLIMYVF